MPARRHSMPEQPENADEKNPVAGKPGDGIMSGS
jgi:hypothetical protein